MVGRNTSGVTIFRTAKDEHVVSVERLADTGEDEAEQDIEGEIGEGGGDAESPPEAPPETPEG
jgi:DNA gyrase subunit A